MRLSDIVYFRHAPPRAPAPPMSSSDCDAKWEAKLTAFRDLAVAEENKYLAENAQLREALDDAHTNAEALQQAIAGLEAKNTGAAKELLRLDESLTAATEAAEQARGAQKQHAACSRELEKARAALAEYENKLQSLDAKAAKADAIAWEHYKRAQSHDQVARQMEEAAAQKQAQLDEVAADRRAVDTKLATLRSTVKTLENSNSQLAAERERLAQNAELARHYEEVAKRDQALRKEVAISRW